MTDRQIKTDKDNGRDGDERDRVTERQRQRLKRRVKDRKAERERVERRDRQTETARQINEDLMQTDTKLERYKQRQTQRKRLKWREPFVPL